MQRITRGFFLATLLLIAPLTLSRQVSAQISTPPAPAHPNDGTGGDPKPTPPPPNGNSTATGTLVLILQVLTGLA